MNFDFMSAKLMHSSWKLHLRDFLDGKPGITEAQATSERDCKLGQWLYGEGLTKYSAVPGMRQLEAEHQELHRAVRRVLELKAAGQTAEAESQYARIDQMSRHLNELLTSIEAAVKKA